MNVNPTPDDNPSCDVCHRTMLKGESAEPYLTPSRERRHVCQLCAPRAQHEGWIRESAAPHEPARPQRPPERRRFFRRGRRRDLDEGRPAEPAPVGDDFGDDRARRAPEAEANGEPPEAAEGTPVLTRLRQAASSPRSPRQVRAVPTNAQLKVERALDLFNGSEHPRTVAGIARSLGQPKASALTSRDSAAEVVLTVAWELSWYEFVVDLSDAREPVRLRSKGQELSELADEAQGWNLEVSAEGTLAPATGATAGEAEPEAPAENVGEDSANSYSH
jgi:hypothetical protein